MKLLISLALFETGAGEGNRTLVCSLEDCRSTIELRPPPMCALQTILKLANHIALVWLVNSRPMQNAGE